MKGIISGITSDIFKSETILAIAITSVTDKKENKRGSF